jgi:DNA processing protein
MLCVVGSRDLSAYGAFACRRLISGLAGAPLTIVSGLAFGADACALEAALDAGLPTIAVPGSGLDDAVIGPRTNLPLAHRILASGGLLLSEHPPEHRPVPRDFPSRNRIMAGLASAVLMIEASESSGTLITAGLAGEYGRDLLCVPHRIGDLHSYGMTRFVRLGADLVTESAHILEALGLPQQLPASGRIGMPIDGPAQTVLDLLARIGNGAPADTLVRAAPLPAERTLAALSELEIAGAIEERGGGWFRR